MASSAPWQRSPVREKPPEPQRPRLETIASSCVLLGIVRQALFRPTHPTICGSLCLGVSSQIYWVAWHLLDGDRAGTTFRLEPVASCGRSRSRGGEVRVCTRSDSGGRLADKTAVIVGAGQTPGMTI